MLDNFPNLFNTILLKNFNIKNIERLYNEIKIDNKDFIFFNDERILSEIEKFNIEEKNNQITLLFDNKPLFDLPKGFLFFVSNNKSNNVFNQYNGFFIKEIINKNQEPKYNKVIYDNMPIMEYILMINILIFIDYALNFDKYHRLKYIKVIYDNGLKGYRKIGIKIGNYSEIEKNIFKEYKECIGYKAYSLIIQYYLSNIKDYLINNNKHFDFSNETIYSIDEVNFGNAEYFTPDFKGDCYDMFYNLLSEEMKNKIIQSYIIKNNYVSFKEFRENQKRKDKKTDDLFS